jgi:integrase
MPAELREPRGNAARTDTTLAKVARQRARSAWRANLVWSPHQLRHTAATPLRKEYGLEAAQVVLGHKTLSVTEIYAEKNVAAARRIMGEVG